MTINSYLKLTIVAFFVATPCFADGVATIAKEYDVRLGAFNTNSLTPEVYEPHTVKINGILKEKENVDERRHASDIEKETILKAVMASVVIHGEDLTYRLPAHGLNAGDSLYRHFEILRLTEELAGGLMAQLNAGFMNIAELTGYGNLYGFSGKDEGVFEGWFKDVVSKHNPGLVQRITSSLKSKYDVNSDIVLFGDIARHRLRKYCVVLVSTYNIIHVCPPLLIHLPDRGGRQRYIVMETPFFDDHPPAGTDSPYTIRAHALVNGDVQPRNAHVGINITNGSNKGAEVGVTNLQGGSVNSHDETFSPNNMWLTNLPNRPLKAGEAFSFVSKIDGDGKMIDTLHIIADDLYLALSLAKKSSDLGDFLQQLSRAHEIFGTETLSHLAKMRSFIVGTI